MNLSEVKVLLTEADIISIIDDFVEIPGLNIDKITIHNDITIEGYYKKIVKIPFKISVELVFVEPGRVMLFISSSYIGIIKVFQWVRNIVLKKLSRVLSDKGIYYEDKNVVLDVKKLLKQAPIKIYFEVQSIDLKQGAIELQAVKINLSLTKEKEIEVQNKAVQPIQLVKKNKERYTSIRKIIEDKIPDRLKGFSDLILLMPDLIVLMGRLFKDKRVPLSTKIICGAVIAYISSPIDILPDFVPVLGTLDDFAIMFIALNKILCEVPENIIRENWQGETDIIITIRQGVHQLDKNFGATNIGKAIRGIVAAVKSRKTKKSKEK